MDPSKSWCIVALPEDNHPVYKVSSEKKPHLTILFLGEQSEPALAIRIIEAIQHTIKTSFSKKFSLGVERRGTLGEDQADVLFFYRDEAGRVRDFRSLLLKNDDIKQACDSTFQYPEWTPHLTLGYPNNPAKPIPDDSHSISWITFDRIALWLEDSDGPEIRLGTYDPITESVEQMHHTERMIRKGMMAMVDSDDFLAHYGVKGMKWGVSKSRSEKKAKVAAYKETKSQHKKATKEVYRKNIDKARASLDDKEAQAYAAKREYKAVKKTEGRRSVEAFKAKQQWVKAADELTKTEETARQLRDGKEMAVALLVRYAKSQV